MTVENWAEIRHLHLAERMPIKAVVRKLAAQFTHDGGLDQAVDGHHDDFGENLKVGLGPALRPGLSHVSNSLR